MSTMKLQEVLSENFNNHEIVVNELYTHVQHNGVLKVEFDFQMNEILKKIKIVKRMSQSAQSKKG